jgi:hypothetical protein
LFVSCAVTKERIKPPISGGLQRSPSLLSCRQLKAKEVFIDGRAQESSEFSIGGDIVTMAVAKKPGLEVAHRLVKHNVKAPIIIPRG